MQLRDCVLKGRERAFSFSSSSLCWLQCGGRTAAGAAVTEPQARRSLGSSCHGTATPVGSLGLTLEREINVYLV